MIFFEPLFDNENTAGLYHLLTKNMTHRGVPTFLLIVLKLKITSTLFTSNIMFFDQKSSQFKKNKNVRGGRRNT